MANVEALQARIKALEAELEKCRQQNTAVTARQKISEMSSEVVDSNPYR